MSLPVGPSLEARLVEAVARIRPQAEAHAVFAERAATLHPAVVAAIRAEGLFALAAPREVGGLAADARTQLHVFEAMAHADSAAGWSLMIGALTTAAMAAYLPDEAIRSIFAGNMPIAAGLQLPMGCARAVPGGFEVSGRWSLASGIRHADWVFSVAALDVPASGGEPAKIHFATPVERVVVESTWDSAFLRGSGSEHYHMDSVFVDSAFTCAYPSPPCLRGSPLFELPFFAIVAPAHVGFALGVARRSLEEIASLAAHRIKPLSREVLRDQNSFRMDLGRAHTRLAAARALAHEVLRSMSERAEHRLPFLPEHGATLRALVAHTTEVAIEITTFAFRSGGTSTLYGGNVLGRCFRDIHAAAQHVAASDDAYDAVARCLLGSPSSEQSPR